VSYIPLKTLAYPAFPALEYHNSRHNIYDESFEWVGGKWGQIVSLSLWRVGGESGLRGWRTGPSANDYDDGNPARTKTRTGELFSGFLLLRPSPFSVNQPPLPSFYSQDFTLFCAHLLRSINENVHINISYFFRWWLPKHFGMCHAHWKQFPPIKLTYAHSYS